MAEGMATTSPTTDTVGPPLAIIVLGFVSQAASVVLLTVGSSRSHVIGYLVGTVVPLVLIGFVRRADLDRRRSPFYVANSLVGPALVVMAVAAMVLAGVHVWAIATDLAS
jgi:hypothetical protein